MDRGTGEAELMKRIFLTAVILALILLAVGCSGRNTVQAFLGKEFSLAIGQSATISGGELSVKLLDVTEDSRCPKGVTCVWAGQVNCMVEVTINGNTDKVKLTETGGSTITSQTIRGYIFAFKVEPYPEAGKQISKDDYRLKLSITK
ncbi:MAG: hypothetical protein NTV30_08520 [Chloroflexi bacterium]|nr:hypothetical protein [Chloroflexota bacterium]